ncbi:MFS transporter [Alkalihalobacillus deserti]|uniref:MFS transporter n=1 Tax=Alkalihalobacillus deserti TaxID=2879466 RepID=UPI001D13C350|nr:MFS transporter [Alkalihalobacillus deserti]
MSSFRTTQTVLFFLIFYFVYADVALSPFYPQFFNKVFGIEDLEYTAFYIFIARLTVVIAVPIWGLLSKYFEVKYLLYVGQWVSAVMMVGMAGALNEQQFLLFTILLLIGKSSFFLIYPLLIELNGQGKRSAVVGMYHMIFHGAIILGTLSGAWIIRLDDPLLLFYGLAGVEVILWLICCLTLRKLSSRKKVVLKRESVHSTTSKQVYFVLLIGLVIFAFHTANNMIRPYFTTYTINDFQLSIVESSILFMVPSAMAIIAYPVIRKVCSQEKVPFVFALALAVLSISLILQGVTTSFIVLAIGRIFYGFFLAIAQSALELYLFNKSSNHMQVYTVASSFQNAGLLVAPLLASTSVISYNLAAPFVFAGAICLLTLIVARLTLFKEAKPLVQKIDVKEVG